MVVVLAFHAVAECLLLLQIDWWQGKLMAPLAKRKRGIQTAEMFCNNIYLTQIQPRHSQICLLLHGSM